MFSSMEIEIAISSLNGEDLHSFGKGRKHISGMNAW